MEKNGQMRNKTDRIVRVERVSAIEGAEVGSWRKTVR